MPFSNKNIPDIKITGHVARQYDRLTIHYSLAGEINNVLLPTPSMHPARKDNLWTATCFEFFLALPGELPYWEFNLSPSGDWNIYRIDAYRRIGFREETAIQELPLDVRKQANSISVDAGITLSPIIPLEIPIQVGITSVVQTKDKHETYWALIHPNPQADFHLRESFTIQL